MNRKVNLTKLFPLVIEFVCDKDDRTIEILFVTPRNPTQRKEIEKR